MLIKEKTTIEYFPQITTFKLLYQIRIFFFMISSKIIISVNEEEYFSFK